MSSPCEQKEKIDRIEVALHDIDLKLAVIDERLRSKVSDIDRHIAEGEKSGGWRDRLVIVEQKVLDQYRFAIMAGVLGGLIGAGVPAAVTKIASFLGA